MVKTLVFSSLPLPPPSLFPFTLSFFDKGTEKEYGSTLGAQLLMPFLSTMFFKMQNVFHILCLPDSLPSCLVSHETLRTNVTKIGQIEYHLFNVGPAADVLQDLTPL